MATGQSPFVAAMLFNVHCMSASVGEEKRILLPYAESQRQRTVQVTLEMFENDWETKVRGC